MTIIDRRKTSTKKDASTDVVDENNFKTEGTPVKGRLSLKRIDNSDDSSNDSSSTASSDGQTPTKKFKETDISDPTTYNPASKGYDPIKDAVWAAGNKVPLMAWAKTLEQIEKESSRLRMIEILSNFLSSIFILSPKDVIPSIYLCCNKVAPDYEGIELGVGDSIIVKALAEATGRKMSLLKADIEKRGDIGLVAESSRSTQRQLVEPPKLTVSGVYDKLKEIALMSGQSSTVKKGEKIKALMVSCRDSEARYLVRSLQGKLRIGLAEQSLLCSIAQAIVVFEDPSLSRSSGDFTKRVEEVTSLLKEAYCECPNFDRIIAVILKNGASSLPEKCKITPGIPLKPMLSHPSKGVSDVLKRFEDTLFTCEYKYDGERAQIHLKENGEIGVFSRNQENNTTKYPDIISAIPGAKKPDVKSFILDTEAVAWDRSEKKILPFQVLSTRKRKDVKEEDIKVRVCIFAFDILYLNGRSLTKLPLRERRQLLQDSFTALEGVFMFAQGKDVTTTEEIEELVDIAVKDKCEGLMIKCLEGKDATYDIAKRSHNWLKLKKDYLEGVGDSLDLVVIGGWFGKGKRTGTFGGFLLACYDSENEEFQTICKIGTGFKDDDLEQHSKFFKEHIISEPKTYYVWDEGVKPDVWFDAIQVWEVKCADLSISPVHRAAVGRVDDEKGISLRFPRFIRIRDDKKPEEATNTEQVSEMYLTQESVKGNGGEEGVNEDD